MRGGSSSSNERGSMINQLAERMRVAALSMSPEHLVDKFLDRLEELRGALALAEINSLARSESRSKMLFD
jgi:ribosome assembly protein YihI (activator of Der GTPase)